MSSSAMHAGRPLGSFLGREQELAELRAALGESSARGHLFLISREPGTGTTGLAGELAADSQRRTLLALVNSAACLLLLILSVATLIVICASWVCGSTFADDGSLLAMAAHQFPNLS